MQQLSQSSDLSYELTGPPLLDDFLEPECLSEWVYSKIPSPKVRKKEKRTRET